LHGQYLVENESARPLEAAHAALQQETALSAEKIA